MADPLDGIADADALLGCPFPLPTAPLPLARWVDVAPVGDGFEVAWSLDDSRPGTPGRLALYAGPDSPPAREVFAGLRATDAQVGDAPAAVRRAPLEEAQPSLRPVSEITWRRDGLVLRLTGQGPWRLEDLLEIAASVRP